MYEDRWTRAATRIPPQVHARARALHPQHVRVSNVVLPYEDARTGTVHASISISRQQSQRGEDKYLEGLGHPRRLLGWSGQV